MKTNEADVYQSKYLKPGDLDEESTVVTISGLTVEILGDRKKPIMKFEEFDKEFILNKTNWLKIEKMLGNETDEWTGKQISLQRCTVDFNDKPVPSIRIEAGPEITDTDIPF